MSSHSLAHTPAAVGCEQSAHAIRIFDSRVLNDDVCVTLHSDDVYNAPALQKGGPKDPLTTPSQYLVFEMDIEKGQFRAFQRVGDEWVRIRHTTHFDAFWR